MEAFLVVTRFDEDYDWVQYYTDNYIIYNRGTPITEADKRIYNTKNVGGNQRDLLHYCYKNYATLPDVIGFIQANPYDHCKKSVFDKLITNTTFTPLEYYGTTPANKWEKRDADGGYMELNNSWYIGAHNSSQSQDCKYGTFDEFMETYFEDYTRLGWLRFTPGSQYIVTKEQILNYPRVFWYRLMKELSTRKSPTEAHIIERALYYILTGKYILKSDFIVDKKKDKTSTEKKDESLTDT